MAAGGAALGDVMDVGSHCAHAGCSQLDFLPFRCAACAATFCAAHRGKQQHACPHAGARPRAARPRAARVEWTAAWAHFAQPRLVAAP